MNPYRAYQQQQTPAWTRIDMLLALFDGGIDRLEQASAALRRNDRETARTHLQRAQLLVCELAAGLDLEYGDLPRNLLQLYEFVVYCIGQGTLDKIEAGLNILRNLREGMESIRAEAIQLERDGVIPPIDAVHRVEAIA